MSDSDEKNNAIELLMEFYKINDNYHNSKDNFVWLCTALYLTLSGSLSIWFLSQRSICQEQNNIYHIFITTLSVFSMVYVGWQTWYKSRSVYITDSLNKLLEGNIENITRQNIINRINRIFTPKSKIERKLIKTLDKYKRSINMNQKTSNELKIQEEIKNIEDLINNSLHTKERILQPITLILSNGRSGLSVLFFLLISLISQWIFI